MEMKNEGTIFNIQRFSLHDGPGIRTTVFLKGCNARCSWCHNPESWDPSPQLSVNRNNCTATSVIGRSYTADEVMKTVLKDKKYYENSGGGVTFSGGEPTFQYNFLMTLLELSKEAGLHTCVETNGLTEQNKLRALCGYVDLFLVDFKIWDDTLHRLYVGTSNKRVFENLELLDSMKKEIILRCPIIPTINDKPEHFAAIKQLREKFTSIRQVELMPYHKTGISKWENIGKEYSLPDIQTPSKAEVEKWNKMIK